MNGAYISPMNVEPRPLSFEFRMQKAVYDLKSLARTQEKMEMGQAFDRQDLPDRIVWNLAPGKAVPRTPSYISSGMNAISAPAVGIFRSHDLGDGFLWPLDCYYSDATTPAPGEWYGLHIGAWKDTWLPEQSTAVSKAMGRVGTSLSKLKSGEGDMVLSKDALAGPDLWFEKKLGSTDVFFSAALVRALSDRGYAEDFYLYPCKIA